MPARVNRPLDPDFPGSAKKLRAALVPSLRGVTTGTDIPTIDDDLQGAYYDVAGGCVVTCPSAGRAPEIEPGYEFPGWNIGAGAVTVEVEDDDVLVSDGDMAAVAQGNAFALKLVREVDGVRTWMLVGGLS